MAIGQGYVWLSPMEMACYAASLARNEIYTKPTLLHDPQRSRQHSDPIGLTPAQRAALVNGMIGCTLPGQGNTAYVLSTIAAYQIPGVQIAGKTGTAQVPGHKNVAWFICFAPANRPEIAMAIAIEGDTPGETFAGGQHAAPVAAMVLKKYFEKKTTPRTPTITPFKKS